MGAAAGWRRRRRRKGVLVGKLGYEYKLNRKRLDQVLGMNKPNPLG